MSLEYAYEKLSLAVSTMAQSTKSLQDRLFDAFLVFQPLSPADFPSGELRTSFEEIKHALTRQPPKGDEGSVKATLQVMNEKEAADLIEKIVALSDAVTLFVEAQK